MATKITFLLLAMSLALPAAPGVGRAVAAPLGIDAARHLLSRTSFSGNVSDIRAFALLTREQAAERLLAGTGQQTVTAPPPWTEGQFEKRPRLVDLSAEERRAFRQEQFRKLSELRSWWLTEMLTTQSPLIEKMTLFWHNHFVSSQQKVRSLHLMYRQNRLLRQYALGNFGEFLHAVSKDPAMVIYLDSRSNRKEQPNENFAREVMELFTLGEGNYAERDIREAARAFTGWSIDADSGEFLFRRFEHDDGLKTVLGRSGNFDGDAVLDILLEQPQTAEFIVAKLWREFVSPAPDRQEVRRIARVFRDSRYEIRAALRALLTSDAFYAPQNRGLLIKSPVELVVGTLRQFGFTIGEPTPFVFVTAQLGQNLFAPPNVKGWPGGEAWIDSTTLLARKQFLARLFRADETQPLPSATAGRPGDMDQPKGIGLMGDDGRARFMRAMADIHFDSGKWLSQFRGADPAALQRLVLATVLANPLPVDVQGVEAIRRLTQDPAYQLK